MTNFKMILNDKNAKIIGEMKGGMMNKSTIILSCNQKYVLYEPVGAANDLVDRDLESQTHDIAESLGISNETIYFDKINGIKINKFIEGDSLNNLDTYNIEKVAEIMHKLHSSKRVANSDYNPFKRLANYENERRGFEKDNDDYQSLRKILDQYQKDLEASPKVLCHNDAQKSNIIESTNGKYFFIDFEFAANNDEIYDIATFGNNSVEEGYELLKKYYENNLKSEQIERYYLWRIFVSLQWYNVAIIKHFNGEGSHHGMDFYGVANFFMNNAKEAYKKLVLFLKI